MNPEKLDQILDHLMKSLEKAGNFVADQAPLFIQELITWQRCWTIVSAVAFLALAVTLLVAGFKLWGRAVSAYEANVSAYEANRDTYGDSHMPWGIGAVVAWVASATFCALMAHSSYEAVKVWCAPRVFLLDYAKDLVKPAAHK